MQSFYAAACVFSDLFTFAGPEGWMKEQGWKRKDERGRMKDWVQKESSGRMKNTYGERF